MSARYYVLEVGIQRVGEAYRVDLSHADPGSQARVAPVRGGCLLDPALLLPHQLAPDEYGRTLTAQLLAEDALRQRFLEVERASQAAGCHLRIVLVVDPSAQEVQGLRWELLRHPETDALIACSERLLFSRFLVSRDWRPVQLRSRSELTAIVAVAAPHPDALARYSLAAVDRVGETARIQQALTGLDVRPLADVTVDTLIAALRPGVDLLYLVCHGAFQGRSGAPLLYLEDGDGGVAPVDGGVLAERIAELQVQPRLIVLASCQSAGDGEAGPTPHATLAGRLADAGVPAILAMQGRISMATVERMMPAFFAELLVDGQIDRAMAVARGVVRDAPDAWMPALSTRLRDGRLWYTAGFTEGSAQDKVWGRLLTAGKEGRLLPILGPELNAAMYGGSAEIARELGAAHRFPLSPRDQDDLPRVMQFLEVDHSPFDALALYKQQLVEGLLRRHRHWLPAAEAADRDLGTLLELVAAHQREDPRDPFRLLATLPARIFLTANFDWAMEQALVRADRQAQQQVSLWRKAAKTASAEDHPPIPLGGAGLRGLPTPRAPLVYHAFGAFGLDGHGQSRDDTLVLTEDDYLDYLGRPDLTPHEVEGELVDNALLFLGFQLADWRSHLLFRLIMRLGGVGQLRRFSHVGVQIEPEMSSMIDTDGARRYLAKYFGSQANIEIYWGSSADFLVSLHNALDANGGLSLDPPRRARSGF